MGDGYHRMVGDRKESGASLDATDSAVYIPIVRRADLTVVAVFVHSEQRIIRRDGAPFCPAHRPKLRNGFACPDDGYSLATF